MPLILEIFDENRKKWVESNQLIPGDPTASISNFSLSSGREIYIIGCEPDDSFSTIYQSMSGVDVDVTPQVRVTQTEAGQLKVIKQLKDQETYTMNVLTDRSLIRRKIRFKHIQVRYGMRKCLLCGKEKPANEIGAHIFQHSDDELSQWPGGTSGVLSFLKGSLNRSIRAAQRFPRIVTGLEQTFQLIDELQKRLNAPRN